MRTGFGVKSKRNSRRRSVEKPQTRKPQPIAVLDDTRQSVARVLQHYGGDLSAFVRDVQREMTRTTLQQTKPRIQE
jgi:hypothetical protein